MPVPLEVDHVLVGVGDLADATAALESRLGLSVAGGGRHPGWGTANRIVPLGSTYLELLTVVDEEEAAGTVFGQWVHAMLDGGPRLGWAARTDAARLDALAAALGQPVVEGSRVDAEGRALRWRLAGVEMAAAEPARPFLIAWEAGTPHPAAAAVTHPAGPVALARLEVGGGSQTAAWLGGDVPGVVVGDGRPVVHAVRLAAATGEIVIDDAVARALG